MAPPSPSSSFFDRWSATYDFSGLQVFTYRPIHDAIVARLDDAQPSTVVDLGCGTGQLTQRLIELFPEATVAGVDLSPGMLHQAQDRLASSSTGETPLLLADAQQLPFARASVDVVVCTESFHWYPDQAGALEGLADIIRPGGRLLVASIAALTGVGDDMIRRVTSIGGRPIRANPPRRMRRLLHDAGFEVMHQRRIPRLAVIGWPVLTEARRR